MTSHDWSNADAALAAVIEAYPLLPMAVDTARARAEDAIAALSLNAGQDEQATADIMRTALAAELSKISTVPGDVTTGVRNSIVLRPDGDPGVVIHVLRTTRRGGVQGAGRSRVRALEFEQAFIDTDCGRPTCVVLVLTWDLTPEGVSMHLSMPIDAGSATQDPALAWRRAVPLQYVAAAAVATNDIDHADDLDDLVSARPAAEADNGDDPA